MAPVRQIATPEQFVRWFRDSSPYIHAHRGRVFVVSFGGEAVADGRFAKLAQDFALLNSLGVRLVLVHGIRPQVERLLRDRGASLRYHDGLRVTDSQALDCVKAAAGAVRVEIEALLSMGVANSPMAGARIRVTSGNFVTAKPLGIRDGIDFQHTGEVRRIDADSIRTQIDAGNLVLLSPVGFSPTGEVFNLSAEEVATATAIALKADKLLLLLEDPLTRNPDGAPIQQLTTSEALRWLAANESITAASRPHLQAACSACGSGVTRAHLIDRHIDGAILLELFTRDGVGALVSQSPYEEMRAATLADVGGILDLIGPLEADGILVQRTRERLEIDIMDYTIVERDGLIIGCAALHAFPAERTGELACLVVHPDYRGANRGDQLLERIEDRARAAGLERLFALTTHSSHWFLERGFRIAPVDALPSARRETYNPQRNSRIVEKLLTMSRHTAAVV
ncbi:MAG: amino-acid N-acetyltransferase [Methylotetracoccus sp.]